MSAPRCAWGGDCQETAVVSLGILIPDHAGALSWRPMCQEHATYYAVDPGNRDAARRNAAETGIAPYLVVIDPAEPVACETCGRIAYEHRYGDDCQTFVAPDAEASR